MGDLTHTIVIVSEAAKPAAKALAVSLSAENTEVFGIGLSADGKLPATHWWIGAPLSDEHRAIISAQVAALKLQPSDARLFEQDQFSPDEALAACGLRRIETIPPGLFK
jgi:hypothetical protein